MIVLNLSINQGRTSFVDKIVGKGESEMERRFVRITLQNTLREQRKLTNATHWSTKLNSQSPSRALIDFTRIYIATPERTLSQIKK